MVDENDKDTESDLKDDITWPPAPTSPTPPIPKPLGWFRPMADIPFWVLPIIAAFDVLIFTGIYFLELHWDHHPFVLIDAFIRGPVNGLIPFCGFLWVWLGAKKRRRDNGV